MIIIPSKIQNGTSIIKWQNLKLEHMKSNKHHISDLYNDFDRSKSCIKPGYFYYSIMIVGKIKKMTRTNHDII